MVRSPPAAVTKEIVEVRLRRGWFSRPIMQVRRKVELRDPYSGDPVGEPSLSFWKDVNMNDPAEIQETMNLLATLKRALIL